MLVPRYIVKHARPAVAMAAEAADASEAHPRPSAFSTESDGGAARRAATAALAAYGLPSPSVALPADAAGSSHRDPTSDAAGEGDGDGDSAHYGSGDDAPRGPTLALVNQGFNTVFRYQAPAADPPVDLALRVHGDGGRTPDHVRAEVAWLHKLAESHTTGHAGVEPLRVVRPVLAMDGRLVVEASDAGADAADGEGTSSVRQVTAFAWQRGTLSRTPSLEVCRRLGVAMAQLHEHASRDDMHPTSAPWNTLPSWSNVWQFGTPWPQDTGAGMSTPAELPVDEVEALRAAGDIVQPVLTSLFEDEASRSVIHADLHLGNVIRVTAADLRSDGSGAAAADATAASSTTEEEVGIVVIDFDDSMLGYAVQDLAISLFYLQFDGEGGMLSADGEVSAEYSKRAEALVAGYASVRPLPAGVGPAASAQLVRDLVIVRDLTLASYLSNSKVPQMRGIAQSFVTFSVKRLRTWMAER